MGLHKLSASEKEELRAYIEGFLIKVIASSQSSKLGKSKRFMSNVYADVGDGHWIVENIDGTYIILEDGSLWQIDHLDKIDAMLWLPASNITVIESTSGSLGYNYLLINMDDGEKAHAKYMGQQ